MPGESLLARILGGTLGDSVKAIADAAHEFITTDKDREDFQLKVQQIIAARDSQIQAAELAELQARRDIIVAELQQGDAYTKRARPTIIYAGLAMMAWDYVLIPTLAWAAGAHLPQLGLPDFFWQAWGGVCGAYVLTRGAEKAGGFGPLLRGAAGITAAKKQ